MRPAPVPARARTAAVQPATAQPSAGVLVTRGAGRVAISTTLRHNRYLSGYQDWQTEARRAARTVGVARMAANMVAQTAARVILRIEEQDNHGDWAETQQDAYRRTMSEFRNETLGQGPQELTRLLTWHYQVAGEGAIVNRDTQGGTAEWIVAGLPAILWNNPQPGVATVRLHPGGMVSEGLAFTVPHDQILHFWQPDEDFLGLAVSPMTAAMADLGRYTALARYASRQARSFLAMNGVFWTPSKAHENDGGPEEPATDGEAPKRSALLTAYEDMATTALNDLDDETLESVIPPMVWWDGPPPESINVGRGLDSEGTAHRAEAMMDFARDVDAPAALIVNGGSSDENHWNAWMTKERFLGAVAPTLDRVTHQDLTVTFLYPVLRLAGVAEVDLGRYRVGYDPTPVIKQPDESDKALHAWLAGLLSAPVALEKMGFDRDALAGPEDLERLGMVLSRARADTPPVVPGGPITPGGKQGYNSPKDPTPSAPTTNGTAPAGPPGQTENPGIAPANAAALQEAMFDQHAPWLRTAAIENGNGHQPALGPARSAAALNPTDTGVMVSIDCPPELASSLALDGGEAPDAMHLTLVHVPGDSSDLDPALRGQLLDATDAVGSEWAPVTVRLTHVERFAPDDQGLQAVCLVDQGPELPAIHADLASLLDQLAVPYSNDHGFRAHLTLGYFPEGVGPESGPLAEPATFDAKGLNVHWGAEVAPVPFSGSKTSRSRAAALGLVRATEPLELVAATLSTPAVRSAAYGSERAATRRERQRARLERRRARWVAAGAAVPAHRSIGRTRLAYSPDQARDEHGRFGEGDKTPSDGGSAGGVPSFAGSVFDPVPALADGKAAYMDERGMASSGTDFSTVAVDPSMQADLANAFDALPLDDSGAHDAYDQLAAQVSEQYAYLTDTLGVNVEFTSTDPYPDGKAMAADLADNNHLAVLSTEATGSHAYLTDRQNDEFRAVHDAFGHAAIGRGFDRNGEEAAFQSHAEMFRGDAVRALATETRGQNAVLITRGDFPDQKVALLPEGMERVAANHGLALAAAAIPPSTADADNLYDRTGVHHASNGRWSLAARRGALARRAYSPDQAREHGRFAPMDQSEKQAKALERAGAVPMVGPVGVHHEAGAQARDSIATALSQRVADHEALFYNPVNGLPLAARGNEDAMAKMCAANEVSTRMTSSTDEMLRAIGGNTSVETSLGMPRVSEGVASVSGMLYDRYGGGWRPMSEGERNNLDNLVASKQGDIVLNPASEVAGRYLGDQVVATPQQFDAMARDYAASQLIGAWASTSNDTDPVALGIQDAAGRVFDLRDTAGVETVAGALSGGAPPSLDASVSPVLEDFVQAQYGSTQELLGQAGVTSIDGYRGMGLAFTADNARLPERSEQDIAMRPLSSFSTDDSMPDRFGMGIHVTASAEIPAERIVGMPGAGVGCLGESELVVMGGTDTYTVEHPGAEADASWAGSKATEEWLNEQQAAGAIPENWAVSLGTGAGSFDPATGAGTAMLYDTYTGYTRELEVQLNDQGAVATTNAGDAGLYDGAARQASDNEALANAQGLPDGWTAEVVTYGSGMPAVEVSGGDMRFSVPYNVVDSGGGITDYGAQRVVDGVITQTLGTAIEQMAEPSGAHADSLVTVGDAKSDSYLNTGQAYFAPDSTWYVQTGPTQADGSFHAEPVFVTASSITVDHETDTARVAVTLQTNEAITISDVNQAVVVADVSHDIPLQAWRDTMESGVPGGPASPSLVEATAPFFADLDAQVAAAIDSGAVPAAT